MRQKFEVLNMLVKWKNMMEKHAAEGLRSSKLMMLGSTRINNYDLITTLVLVFTSQMKNMG